jgi:hypothetical protein
VLQRHHDDRDTRELLFRPLKQFQTWALRVVEIKEQQLGLLSVDLRLERIPLMWSTDLEHIRERPGQLGLPHRRRQVYPK